MPCTMERRERYDPEDIERLLQDRGFDELLDEERAYVLRHLAGRAEYEAMRALLLQVRADDWDHEGIEAPPELRNELLEVFRSAQQRPTWRIWLNSIGLSAWPWRAGAAWRPALAIASLALLITAGVWVARRASVPGEGRPLAELEIKKPKPAPALDRTQPAEAPAPEQTQEAGAPRTEHEGATTEAPMAMSGALAVPQDAMTKPVKVVLDEAQAPAEDMAKAEHDVQVWTADKDLALEEKSTAPAATSHVVTEAEFARNQTLANATGKSRRPTRAAEQTAASIGSLAGSPEVVALMASGW